jgi:hypothetical protein
VAAIRLPDGSELGIYEPKHPLPPRPLPGTGVALAVRGTVSPRPRRAGGSRR